MNQFHFICPKAAATGIMSMKVPSVARVDTTVLSVIPYFSVGDWRPSKAPRIAMMAENSARLATQHAISMGHHTCCFRDRHADRKRRLDGGVLGFFWSSFSLPGLGLVEQGEDDMFAEAVLTGVDLVGAWSSEHPTLIETDFLGIVTRFQNDTSEETRHSGSISKL